MRAPAPRLAAAALALLSCQRNGPGAAAADREGEPAPPSLAAAPGPPPGASPPLAPGQPGGRPDARELLAQVESLKREIADRPKSPALMLALGNLYLENQRPLDAIDWYRQAIEAGQREGPGSAALVARARARRAYAFQLAGNRDLAMAEHEANLALDPGQPDSLLALALLLVADERADAAQLLRARQLFRRTLAVAPAGERSAEARAGLAAIEVRLRGGAGPGAPGAVRPSAGTARRTARSAAPAETPVPSH